MCPILCNVYGPFSIHSFGLMIALGIIIFSWLVMRDPKSKAILSTQQFIDILLVGTLAGIVGCRVLYIATNWPTMQSVVSLMSVWEGGLSMLGGIVGILLVVPWFLARKNIAVVPFFDLIALYAPIIEMFARIGCFLAGCCFGKGTAVLWAVVYSDVESIAPLGTPLHPTQLYTALASLLIFVFLYTKGSKLFTKPGQMFAAYLILTGIERLSIDFFRGDQEFFIEPSLQYLAINQWIALLIVVVASIGFIGASYYVPSTHCSVLTNKS